MLRGVDFSESSRIVTFVTPGRGRLSCMAAGVRRRGSRLGGLLDTGNRLELVYYWKEGRSVQKLAEAALLDAYSPIKADLDKAVYGAFPLEVAGKVAQENEPSEALYALLRQGFEGLAGWGGDVRAHAVWQVVHLLAVSGYQMAFDDPAPATGSVPFSYATGGPAAGERPDRWLTVEDWHTLCALAESADRCPPVTIGVEVFRAVRGYAAHHLETGFSSLRVIDQLYP